MALVGDFVNMGCFYIKCKTTKIQFLIDPGATMSLIPRKCVPKDTILYSYKGPSLTNVNGKKISVHGVVDLIIDVNLHKKYKVRFLVADIFTPLLGVDFFNKHKIDISTWRQKLLPHCAVNVESKDHSDQLNVLLKKFKEVFNTGTNKLTSSTVVVHHMIDTTSSRPLA